jgi:hypothetical protein
MGNKTVTPDHRDWLTRMSQAMGSSTTPPSSPTVTAAPQPIQLAFPPRTPDPLSIDGLRIDPATMKKIMEDSKKADEKRKKDAEDALAAARKWLCGVSKSDLLKMSYPAILAKIKQDFPAVADLPKPKVLMDMVEKVLTDNGYMMDKGFLGDPQKLAIEKVIAAYIAALPKSIKAKVADGGITLVMTGASDLPSAGAGGKKPEKFEFKNKDYTIQVSNEAWQTLDPKLRAKWKGLNDEATALQKLQDAITSLKKEWESKGADGTSSKVELEARIKDLEAEFKGRWDTLQQEINATAKLSTDGLKATITEAKKKVGDQKAGAELELKFDEMSASIKTFATTPDLKTALTVTGSAEKITAKIEAEAIKTGTVVTLAYEKSLKEVKEQLELQVKQGNATVAATLSKEAGKLDGKLKEFKDSKSKDFAQVKGLEDGLEKLKLQVKAEFKTGNFKFTGSGYVDSGGTAGGNVKVDMMLKDGISFLGEGQKISFSADVSNKSYTFALMFSVGEMPDLKDVNKANAEADDKIKKLYAMVQDTKIRNMDDATKIKDALAEVLKPLKKSVAEMKKADKKEIAVEVGVTLTGDLPGGQMPPPVPGFGLKVHF